MTITQYIAHLRAKPEHVRTRIAIGTTSAITGVVAIAWVTTLAATGAFSLSSPSKNAGILAQTSPTVGAAQGTGTNFSQMLGAVTAGINGTTSAPTLTITDDGSSSSLDRTKPAPDATVIPF